MRARGAARPGGIAAAVAALALTAAACGDPSSSPTAASPPPSAVPTTRPTPTDPPLRAGDYVLTAGAVTRGFTAESAEEGKNADGGSITRIAACLGVPTERLSSENSGEADGPDFSRPDNPWVLVGSWAEIVPTSLVVDDTALLVNPRFATCAAQDLQRELNSESTGSGVTYELVGSQMPQPPEGATALLRVGMNITAEGQTTNVVFDIGFFFVGRVESSVTYTNAGGPPPAAHWQRIADQIAAKLQNQ
jgi:hypothetical protein